MVSPTTYTGLTAHINSFVEKRKGAKPESNAPLTTIPNTSNDGNHKYWDKIRRNKSDCSHSNDLLRLSFPEHGRSKTCYAEAKIGRILSNSNISYYISSHEDSKRIFRGIR